jgi:hypothetical protein
MTSQTLHLRPIRSATANTAKMHDRPVAPDTRMFYSRLVGGLFLGGFVTYGAGLGLASSVTGAPGFLSTLAAHQTVLVVGALLMLLNTAVDIGKAVLLFPVLERHSRRTAYAYLATMIVEVVLLDVGVLALLSLPSIAQHATDAGAPWANAMASLAIAANETAYQVGEMVLGVGCIILCVLLYRSRLVPRFLAISGLIGYPCLVAGTIAELFGLHIGLMLTIPGMFFELALPLWLFTKGFEPRAYPA